MKKEMKTITLIVRLTEREKAFLVQKGKEEDRKISGIVNAALEEKYKEYKKIRKRQ